MTLIPEIGIPFTPDAAYPDLRQRAEAACYTAIDLEEYGLDLSPAEEDYYTAAVLLQSYAHDPEGTSTQASDRRIAELRPAALVLTGKILSEFGRLVVKDSLQIRNMVTNKLILESEHDDARIRLRALELLGKISDVGLFTEKREITITHNSTEELRAKLKSKLHNLIKPDESAETVEYEVVDEG